MAGSQRKAEEAVSAPAVRTRTAAITGLQSGASPRLSQQAPCLHEARSSSPLARSMCHGGILSETQEKVQSGPGDLQEPRDGWSLLLRQGSHQGSKVMCRSRSC